MNAFLSQLCRAYKETNNAVKQELMKQSIAALQNAEQSLKATEHGNFSTWYAGDRVFGFKGLYEILNRINKQV